MELKAVVLDMDGTITTFNIDYIELRRVALDLLTEMNLRTPDMNENLPVYSVLRRLKATIDADTYAVLRNRLYRLLEGVEMKAAQKVTIYPGVMDTLNYLQKRALKLGLVTNNGRLGTNLTLSRLGLSGFFHAVVTRDDCEEMKPDAGPVREVLRKLSVGVENAILVGDGVLDIEAARATGLSSVAVATGPFSDKLIKSGPDYILGSINDVPELVELLDGNSRRK